MNGKAIIYPYWENVDRGYEDILALMLLFRIIFIIYPIVLFVIFIIYLWKHRTWTFRDVKNFAERKWEEARLKRKAKKEQSEKEEEFLL